jgi:DNA-binding CsgD family transcriptional regulator
MSARLPDSDVSALTEREREVLRLLKQELTNEQIAARLGISLDGAKYHVSQILSKLGVSSREEAAALAESEERHGSRWAAVPIAFKLAGAAVVASAAVGLGVLAIGVAGGGGEEDTTQRVEAASDWVYDLGGAPRIGEDHWHAVLKGYAGGEELPVIPAFDSGIHTHGDAVLHVHPQSPDEEGANATLARFFANAGGELTDTSLRWPGTDVTYRNGDPVPGDGRPGQVVIKVNAEPEACEATSLPQEMGRVPSYYVPHDGDIITISFIRDGPVLLPTCGEPPTHVGPTPPVTGEPPTQAP